MPSPFPGMDPYLEGQRWEDFHLRFIYAVAAALAPALRPRYVALLGERLYVEHVPEAPRDLIGPDVTVVEEPRATAPGTGGGMATLPPPFSLPLPMPEPVREVYLEVRHRETAEPVTVLEVLSPTNKRRGADGRREYLEKRAAVLCSKTHLVEIDLLRGGERLPMAGPLPPAEYYAIVSRAPRRPMADVWPISLREPLPVLPVPLAGGDPDAPVDLQATFTQVYDVAGYDYSLARGVDAHAHRGALVGGGRTLAVLGCGLDVPYPWENQTLAAQIVNAGALLSEYPLGAPPDPWHFPSRNRIVSGLSLGVVVLEAPRGSGALITAACAVDQNRDVFAVPGSIDNPRNYGPHSLIKDGAKLVESVDDILAELGMLAREAPAAQAELPLAPPELIDEERRLWEILSNQADCMQLHLATCA